MAITLQVCDASTARPFLRHESSSLTDDRHHDNSDSESEALKCIRSWQQCPGLGDLQKDIFRFVDGDEGTDGPSNGLNPLRSSCKDLHKDITDIKIDELIEGLKGLKLGERKR